MHFNENKFKRSVLLYILIHPFLFIVNILDFIIGLILPYKYEDCELPEKDAILSKLTDSSDPGSPYRSTLYPDLMTVDNPNSNLYTKFASCVEKFADLKTMGVREINSIDDEVQSNGKTFKKYSMGEYKWSTQTKMFEKINNFSNGLLSIGLKSEMNVSF